MMMSGEVEQSRRNKGSVVSLPPCELMSLPYDMVLNCLARVSRSDLGSLSLVSKSIRSMVASPEMYETRSRMGFREESIYVCLDTPCGRNPAAWFILRRVKGKMNRLIPIPSFPTPTGATFVSTGWGIYVIGGMIEAVTTSRVWFLDCRTHTWSELPSMRVARYEANAGVLDGKIYVTGGCLNEDPEVFDPKTQTWSRVVIPEMVMNEEVSKVAGPDSYVYKFWSEEGMWDDFFLSARDDCCAIDRLLFSCDIFGKIMWCDPWSGVKKGEMEWYKVNGLEDLQGYLKYDLRNEIAIILNREQADVWHCYMLNRGYRYGLLGLNPGFKLSKSGGNIVVFWGVIVPPYRMQVWCAEVSPERRQDGQVWGIIQCIDHVFTIDPALYVLSSINACL
ncbi:unnamed protein product [Eruca vesicaria subsp. sativa]|uniref:F-box domain-containing protein n=1 Tax=Eruca vesicaria subsp. sativa TaxID=29727 RepID=A0ABC8JM79_ERUVS|nr:unnamed protein product [Eruca vesicaria subsp. sativa]